VVQLIVQNGQMVVDRNKLNSTALVLNLARHIFVGLTMLDRTIVLSITSWSHKIMFVSKGIFHIYSVKYFTKKHVSYEKPLKLSPRKFKSLFLYNINEVVALWDYLQRRQGRNLKFNRPEVLLWALYYLKVYPTWDQMALTTGITEKTLRKWVGIVVDYISEVDDLVRTSSYL
jgi:hypothetical protein